MFVCRSSRGIGGGHSSVVRAVVETTPLGITLLRPACPARVFFSAGTVDIIIVINRRIVEGKMERMLECMYGAFTDTNVFADTYLYTLVSERAGEWCGFYVIMGCNEKEDDNENS